MTKKKTDRQFRDSATEIRTAYRQGRKFIELDGKKMRITRHNHTVSKIMGGTSSAHYTKREMTLGGYRKTFKESWLVVMPADGSLIPCYNIALDYHQTRV